MAKIRPQISFCVNCFNYEKYIKECIRSILKLNLRQSFEILVIDDKSNDSSRKIINKIKNKKIKKFFMKRNIGPAKAWEFGIRNANGEIICRIDGDDKYKKQFKTKIIQKIIKNKNIDLIYGKTEIIDEKGLIKEKTASWCRTSNSQFDRHCFERFFLKNDMPTCSMAARKSIWLKAIPINSSWAICDWPCNLRMVKNSSVFFENSIVSSYRLHKSNFSKKINNLKMASTIISVLLEHEVSFFEKLGPISFFKINLLGLKKAISLFLAHWK